MEHIDIQGSRMPKLGLGTWRLAGQECRDVVATAIDLGYRHIDTAQVYENEAEVGAAIMASGIRREEFFLATKVWRDELAFDRVLASVDRSLERLGTGYVDLLLIHWPHEDVPLRETLTAMRAIMEEGRTRHLGVSNFPAQLYDEARDLAPVICNQVEYHVYLHRDDLLACAQRDGTILTAYCPLARGEVAEDPVLREIAADHDKTPAQVALRWLIQHAQVAAIPKTADHRHLHSNLAIFDFALDEAEMARITALDRGRRLVDPEFAPAW